MREKRSLRDSELLVRAGPVEYYVNNGNVSASAYISKRKGTSTSVDVDEKRSAIDIRRNLIKNLNLKSGSLPYLIYNTVEKIRSIPAYPFHAPSVNNDYHCCIQDSDSVRVLSKAKAMILASQSKYLTEDQILNSSISSKPLKY